MSIQVVVLILTLVLCNAQYSFPNYSNTSKNVPFPPCRADDVVCLRRGIRSFFFMMDAGRYGMMPVDPSYINSVSVSLPNDGLTFTIRNANVTGARWTKLLNRQFNLEGGKSAVIFYTDLHITGEIIIENLRQRDPFFGEITIDAPDTETNITYSWVGEKRSDNEDYILIGSPRITIRSRIPPSYFLNPNAGSEALKTIEEILQARKSVMTYLSNEIAKSVMYRVVDNFRIFASKTPVRHFYQYQ